MRNFLYPAKPAAAIRRVFTLSNRLQRWPHHQPSLALINSSLRRTIVFVSDAKAEVHKSRLPRNLEIKSELVWLIDEMGEVVGPLEPSRILKNFDFQNKSFVTVSENYGEDGQYPLCKIMDRAVVRRSELAALRNKQKKKQIQTKTIELTWVVEPHDLETKLRRMKEFLLKGSRVKILVKPKKKGKVIAVPDAENILQRIKDSVNEVGGKEMKPLEGQVLGLMEVTYESKKP
ncbi:hypothetical protein BGHDH14_bgh01530 [Blumeria hordei DH14]|uniref:Translation initiation factor 3 C-terminal domain-containing protein n=1 Tax=Blumeria graminis f. sp. hordei (strain DH14) TaxID=546991 RepID=N1J739_BLUG1|nr:hypothetical protein BGHDH14_bgh01530 [Blumeria hordei DH14]